MGVNGTWCRIQLAWVHLARPLKIDEDASCMSFSVDCTKPPDLPQPLVCVASAEAHNTASSLLFFSELASIQVAWIHLQKLQVTLDYNVDLLMKETHTHSELSDGGCFYSLVFLTLHKTNSDCKYGFVLYIWQTWHSVPWVVTPDRLYSVLSICKIMLRHSRQ